MIHKFRHTLLSCLIAGLTCAAFAPLSASADVPHRHKVCHYDAHHHRVCHWVH